MDNSLSRLHQFITNHHDEEEFRTLCFGLGIPFDDLRGEGLSGKARELILWMGRRRQLDRLLTKLSQTRSSLFDEAGLSTDSAMVKSLYAELPISVNLAYWWDRFRQRRLLFRSSLVLVSLIVLVVIALFLKRSLGPPPPPRFVVSAINTLDGGNQYEITDHWIDAQPVQGVVLDWALEIIPTYRGKPRGEVQVQVKGKGGQLLASGAWDTFTKDSKPLQVQLDPYSLASKVDRLIQYQEDGGHYTYPVTDLSIEIIESRHPSQPLHTDTLTILNTPWYHFAKTSINYLWEGHTTVEVFVKGRNLGAPSEFIVVVEIFDISDVSGKPFSPWTKIGSAVKVIEGVINRDSEFATCITLPGDAERGFEFEFEHGKCYGVDTYIVKKQNYVDFQGSSWEEAGERWRFSNPADFILVCFPTQ